MRETKGSRCLQIKRTAASKRLLVVVGALILSPTLALAQQEEQKGIDQGNYNIKQSIEFGGRFVSTGGDQQTYDTFLNLQQGPRLLGFSTEMRSLDHHATLFDRLYFSNFGYGGDPNDVSRLRISKNKLYNFDALFRRDENFWDYNLQANPLNPVTPFPNGPSGFGAPACTACVLNVSPHLFNTRRKLGDYSLLLRPESAVRFRAGYSRNVVEGPGFSSIHEGTEQSLFENYKTTVNTYRIGVDFRVLPRTNISYDQIWNYFKGDNGITDPFENPLFKLANGSTVDLGWSLNAGANQPCANTFGGAPLGSGNVTPGCSAAFSFLSHGRTRTNTPTEQISLQSNYWKNWDFSASANYSAGDINVFGYNDALFGRVSRTNVRNDSFTGPVRGRRVAGTADFGATWRITDKLSFLDSFHFSNWHDPAEFVAGECSFFSPSLLVPANIFTSAAALPITCAAPAGGVAGTPVHSASSGPDVGVLDVSRFLKQDEKTNLAEVEYTFSKQLGGRLGYRYRSRSIADATFASGTFVFFPNLQNVRTPPSPYNTITCPVANNLADGTCVLPMPLQTDTSEIPIHESAAVIGVWARPIDALKVSFDADIMHADNTFTRVSAKDSKEFRARAKYKAANWVNLNGSINVWLGRNPDPTINNNMHNRAYGVDAFFQPNEKFGLDIGYNYNDVFSQILICYISVANGQPGPGSACPNGPGLVQQLSTYTNKSHYGYFDFTLTPYHRLTAHLGANLTGTNGSQLRLDPQALIPNQVTGPLNSLWLHPFGGVDYNFAKDWTGKVYWDYYGYHEDPTAGAVQDIFALRNFRANLVTVSLRYAF
jgi:hypothetical protein